MRFFLFPRILYRIFSDFSGEIIVKGHLGSTTLYVDGVPQSGGIVRGVWQKGIKALPDFDSPPKVLLLGLGGGTVVKLVKKKWSKSKITAVEIDPQMVAIARTYFGLDKLSGVKIINADARRVVYNEKLQVADKKYNLILVDLYKGGEFPEFIEEPKFVRQLKEFAEQPGVVVYNFLLDEKGKQIAPEIQKKLSELFNQVETVGTRSNQLILAY